MTKQYFLCLSLFCALCIFSCSKDDDGPSGTCSDGIMNQDETGVDCGGACAPCVSCTDGIQNGDEVGVDCGGSCNNLCGPPTSGRFVYGIIDGEEVFFSSGTSGFEQEFCGTGSGDHFKNGAAWYTDLLSGNADFALAISKGFPNGFDQNDVYNMFAIGDYSYGACVIEENGAELEWTDNDVEWLTRTGDQTGSTFTITERSALSGNIFEIAGVFSCKLYAGNEEKTIESGSFRVLIAINF